MKTKEFNISILFIITMLVVYSFFPVNGIFQQVFTIFVFFLILPLFFNKFILKKQITFFGVGLGDYRRGLLWSAYSLFSVSIIFFILSKYFNFFNLYSVPTFITGSFIYFLFYEFIIVVSFIVVYEFYFRGFLMFILESRIKFWAIIVQSLVLLLLVLIIGGNSIIQFIPYLIFAPFAGIITYKSRSILYSGVTQFIILFVLNMIIIRKIG